jgi:hypothetical protein
VFGGGRSAWRRAPIVREHQERKPGMTTATTTPLQSKFGPIVADAAGTITVQEASDVLDYSRLRVCQLLDASAGRVLVTDVLALKSFVPPTKLEPAPAAKLVR